MSDRHEKWEQVPPGTVIPAGQPYRVERWDTTFGARATEYVDDKPHEVRPRDYPVFIDSSWKPPLVLPTTPGSVIEATHRDDTPRLWMMTPLHDWICSDTNNMSTLAATEGLQPIRVLFDAGAAR